MEIITRAQGKKFSQVRLVGKSGSEIVDISSVFDTAEDDGLDVVLVSEDVNPPVVRIQDYNKIEYEKKKARAKSKQHRSDLKEIQLKANISDHDLETKLNNVRKFLERGDKVKVVVRLKGRERENPERANELINRVSEAVECKCSRVTGPQAIAILEPVKVKK